MGPTTQSTFYFDGMSQQGKFFSDTEKDQGYSSLSDTEEDQDYNSLSDTEEDQGYNSPYYTKSAQSSAPSSPVSVPGTADSGSTSSQFDFKAVETVTDSEVEPQVNKKKSKAMPVTWELYYAEQPESAPKEKSLAERIVSALSSPFTFIRDLIFGKKVEHEHEHEHEHGYAKADIIFEGAKTDMPSLSSQNRVDQYGRLNMTDESLFVTIPGVTFFDEKGVAQSAAKLNRKRLQTQTVLQSATLMFGLRCTG